MRSSYRQGFLKSRKNNPGDPHIIVKSGFDRPEKGGGGEKCESTLP